MKTASKPKHPPRSDRIEKAPKQIPVRWFEGPRLQVALAACALCVLVAVAFGNSLDNGFVWDDHQQIVMNPYIRAGAPLAPLFTRDVRFAHQSESKQTPAYRPLQMLTYRAARDWFGAEAYGLHWSSLLFAMAGALAAFAVLRLLTQSIGLAFAAAALFAVHPIHTEAVDWIAALPELGCGLFLLLAFACFLAGQKQSGTGWFPAALSIAMYAIALLWKETALIFPLLIFTWVVLSEGADMSSLRRGLRQSAVYCAILVAFLALRTAVLGSPGVGERSWGLTPLLSLPNMLYLFACYWLKLALPIGLNAYYSFHPIRSLADPRMAASASFVLCVIAALIYFLRRAPLVSFAGVWIVITLLPALNLSGLGRNAFAERYLYLPSLGFCLLLVLAVGKPLAWLRVPVRQSAGAALLFITLTAFTAQTITRNPVWKDDATLFADALEHSPDAPFVRTMVASAESNDPSQISVAEQNFNQAIALAAQQLPPDRVDGLAAYQGLASLYADQGQYERAMSTLEQARGMAPDDPNVLAEQGIVLARAGHGEEAEGPIMQALDLQPDNENLLSALGLIARDTQHDFSRAAQLFARALAAHPEQDDFNASQHNNLGAVYGEQGNFAAAIAEFRQAASITPTGPEYRVNLASALAAAGQLSEAQAQAEEALRLAPNDPNARDILARLAQPR